MKNKKSLLSLALITLVLILGVGYAIVSNEDLHITGQVSAGGNIKVSFLSANNNSNDKVTAETTANTLTASIKVQNLSTVGEKATATYVIQNKETDVDAKVVVDSIKVLSKDGQTDLSNYFSVTTDIDETSGLNIDHEGTKEVTVTVELLETPLTEETSVADITIDLVASAVVPNN